MGGACCVPGVCECARGECVESCAGGSGLAVCQGGLAVCLGGACRVLGGSSFVPGGVWLCARWVLSVCQGGLVNR